VTVHELICMMHQLLCFVCYFLILLAILVTQAWSRKPPVIRKYSAATCSLLVC